MHFLLIVLFYEVIRFMLMHNAEPQRKEVRAKYGKVGKFDDRDKKARAQVKFAIKKGWLTGSSKETEGKADAKSIQYESQRA